MIEISGVLTHFSNPKADINRPYSETQKRIISTVKAIDAITDIKTWPGYAVTPLHSMQSMANSANVASIWYKDESQRFGLKSFKALGGAYAVARQLQKALEKSTGIRPTVNELLKGHWATEASKLVVSCATDGNHGRSVAWGAQMFGCACVIYLHNDVSTGREKAISNFGAKVVRVKGNYDDSVRQADTDAKRYQRIIVSDTSYQGYMDIPKDVALGYTVMLSEVIEQLNGDIPTHVFVQGGVGGLASVVSGYFWDFWGNKRPRLIVVEPEQANCLQLSAKAGKPVVIKGKIKTLMAGLACGEVSVLAWEILATGADDFITLSEEAIPTAMNLLAKGYKQDPTIEAGESAVPGLAAVLLAKNTPHYSSLGLNTESKVLVIGTEGATDPEIYQQLVS